MAVVLCIDFGLKRCGLALSDPAGIIASPLQTIDSAQLHQWLDTAIAQKKISEIVLGYPTRLDGSDSHVTENVRLLKQFLEETYPHLKIALHDERFSSKMASQSIALAGSKKQKQQKGLIDQVAACLILQEYLSER
ncbi:MAG: hypothetical protein RLZZ301_585 [Bacteroidota bacterium]|jgi:putative Holliday junction resolvase